MSDGTIPDLSNVRSLIIAADAVLYGIQRGTLEPHEISAARKLVREASEALDSDAADTPNTTEAAHG